jgi:hypothetical protein
MNFLIDYLLIVLIQSGAQRLYNSPVRLIVISMACAAAFLCLTAIVQGAFASRLSVSVRKGRLRLRAYILGGSGVCIAALSIFVFQVAPPVLKAEGRLYRFGSQGSLHFRDR